jgi:hypothetical protein
LQRGREALRQAQDEALQSPETLSEQLRPIPVVIQAHSDITEDLKSHGARVRSVTRDGVVIITAEVPPAAILGLLALPELKSIELAQPVPPAEGGGGRKMENGGRRMENGG